jgi:hypothetical protein
VAYTIAHLYLDAKKNSLMAATMILKMTTMLSQATRATVKIQRRVPSIQKAQGRQDHPRLASTRRQRQTAGCAGHASASA